MNKCPKCSEATLVKDPFIFYCFNCETYRELQQTQLEAYQNFMDYGQSISKEFFLIDTKAYQSSPIPNRKERFLEIIETPCPKGINEATFQTFLIQLALNHCMNFREKKELLRRIMVQDIEADSVLMQGLIKEISHQYQLRVTHFNKQKHLHLSKLLDTLNGKGKVSPPKRKRSIRPVIKDIGRNLNDLVKIGKIKPVVGREKEIEQLIDILLKRKKNNPVVIGEAGVGKTALVEGLAYELVYGNIDERLKGKEIIEIQTALINSVEYAGELEVRINDLLTDLKNMPNAIVFFDEIHTLIGQGTTANKKFDVADMLKPALSRGDFIVIGATTSQEYKKFMESDAAFERRFHPFKIEELSANDTKEVLYEELFEVNEHYKLEFDYQLVDEIVEAAGQHIRNRNFPDKALLVLEKLAIRQSKKGEKSATRQDILELISDETGISIIVNEEDTLFDNLLRLEGRLKQQVFGQEHAIESVCNNLKITKRNLSLHPEKPDGVFLFTGPTGTGKTYLAKCLAQELFGDKKRLLRLDMNEYSSYNDVDRLLGAYTWRQKTQLPILTKFVNDYPSSILLLDEIEKAHPNVIQLFLQVFDEGTIHDYDDKKLYFSDITIIMTSNAIIEPRKNIGYGDKESENPNALMDDLTKKFARHFPPEILARIDEIILFNKLQEKDIAQILKKEILQKTHKRYKEELGIEVKFTNALIKYLVNIGYDEKYGARNFESVFRKHVAIPLTNFIYENKVQKNSVIRVGCKNKKVEVSLIAES